MLPNSTSIELNRYSQKPVMISDLNKQTSFVRFRSCLMANDRVIYPKIMVQNIILNKVLTLTLAHTHTDNSHP